MKRHENKFPLGAALKHARKNAGIKSAAITAEKLNVTEKAVRTWEGDAARPSIDMLLKMCELYDCDLDYLTGRIYCKSHELQAMHDYTGLSEAALERLHKWRSAGVGGGTLLNTLSRLIEKPSFFKTIRAAYNYDIALRKKTRKTVVLDPEGDTGDMIPSAPKIHLWTASNNFTRCLEDTFGRE